MYRIETVYRMRTVRDLAARAARPRAVSYTPQNTERRARAARAALNAQAVACVNAPARSYYWDVLHVGVKRDPTNFSTPAMRVTFDFFSRPRRVQMRESY